MTLKQSPLVEREKHISQIPAILDNLADRRGTVLALLGEPGIGKTRLAQEVARMAGEHRCQVLQGRSYPVGSDTAYTPVLEMLNQKFRTAGPEKAAAWIKDLPDLGQLFPRLHRREPVRLGDPALEKTRLFESLACLVERIAEELPLVLILEDLQFADPASLEFLHYLCRGMSSFPLLLVLTLDSFELPAHSHVNGFVQALRKEEFYKEYRLGRLSPEGVTRLLSERLGPVLPEGLVPLMMKHSEGVPLFIDEILHALLETGALALREGAWLLSVHSIEAIPSRIKELIKSRIDRIQPEDRKVLLYIAISKGTVPHPVLHRLCRMEEEAFLSVIQRLQASGLIQEELRSLEVIYGIYHALVKEVVYEEFPIMARRRAFKLFIEVLEEGGCDDSEALAPLYYGAGPEADPNRTVYIFLKEADRSFQLCAYATAAKYYKSALQLIQSGRLTEETHRIPGLLKRLGEAHKMLGERGEAERYALEAIRTYMPYGNHQEIARLHGLLSVILWESGDIERSLQYLEDGLAVARKQPDAPEVRYELLHTSLVFLSRLKWPSEYYRVYEELQDVHKLVGTPQAAARAMVAEIDYWTGHVYKENYSPAKVQELIQELCRMEVEEEVLFRGCFVSAINFVCCGQHELSLTYSAQAIETAKRMRSLEYEIRGYWIRTQAHLLSGNWRLALPLVDASFAKARKVDSGRPLIYAYITRGSVNAWMGRYSEARLCLEEMRRVVPVIPLKDGHITDMLSPTEMMIALGTGQAADYYASMNRTRPHYVALPWLNLALWGAVQLESGDVVGARETVHELLCVQREENLYAWALGKRLAGLVELELGDRSSALTEVTEAAERFKEIRMPLEVARTLRLRAELLLEDDPEEAKKDLLCGMEVFEHLNAEYDLQVTQTLMKKLGVRLPKSAAAKIGASKESELSKRELEVARLVAQGLTNIEIAEALIISPRTVSTHLENMYRRLGINSRASLVKYLMEHE